MLSPRLATASAFVLALATGCQALISLDEGKKREEGQGGASSAMSGTGSALSGTSSAGGAPVSTSTSGGAPPSTSSAGGASVSSASAGGAPVSTSSSSMDSSSSSSGGGPTCSDAKKNGNETDIDCGGGCPNPCALGAGCAVDGDCVTGTCTTTLCTTKPTVLILATNIGGKFAVLEGALHPPAGAWAATDLTDSASVNVPALDITPEGRGLGLIRYTKVSDFYDNRLMSTTWANEAWSKLAYLDATILSNAGPAIATPRLIDHATITAHLAYLGQNGKHYYTTLNAAGTFALPVQNISAEVRKSGPSIAALGDDAAIAYLDPNGQPAAQVSSAGVWGAPVGLGGTSPTIAPVIVRLNSASPDLLVVFARGPLPSQLWYATRSGGVWSASQPVGAIITNDRLSLAALPGGGAALGFRATGGEVSTALFTGSPPTWNAPAILTTPGTVTTEFAPSVAHGVAGATLELAYTSGGRVFHTRLIAGKWTPPAQVGSLAFYDQVKIASAP